MYKGENYIITLCLGGQCPFVDQLVGGIQSNRIEEE